MDTRVTQCPRCSTSFRVTDALLAVAAGAVRCGSCLHIFNAREHWLDDKLAEAKKAEAATKSSRPLGAVPIKPPEERREPVIDDDALFDDDSPLFTDERDAEEDDGEGQGRTIFNPASAEFTPAEGEEKSIFGDLMDDTDWLTPNQISFEEPALQDDEADADRWAEELLREDPPPRAAEVTPVAHELSEADRNIQRLSIISDYQLEQDEILASVPETEDKQDDNEYIVLDLPSAYDPGLGRTPPPDDENDGAEAALDTGAEGFNAGDRIGDETEAAPTSRSRNTDPLRLHQFVRERRWPKYLWGFGLVIALALLPAQYLYFNFNNLARGELRPWLANACELVGCQLPPQSDPAHIRTGSLIVRSHPTARGALAVDAIITNLAPFAQPYPELVLQFTDINGSPVAGRSFKPAEYLGGELTGSHLMPIGQPIHIGLEVKDPGPKAVNYLLAVSPAQP